MQRGEIHFFPHPRMLCRQVRQRRCATARCGQEVARQDLHLSQIRTDLRYKLILVFLPRVGRYIVNIPTAAARSARESRNEIGEVDARQPGRERLHESDSKGAAPLEDPGRQAH